MSKLSKAEKEFMVGELLKGTIEELKIINREKNKADLNTGALFITLLPGGRYKLSYIDENEAIGDVEGVLPRE